MIRNQWYAILSSAEVKKGRPVGVKRLNMELVLFRDSNNKVHCLRDQCSHRGAALSKGRVVHDCVQCPFHGIEFKGSGECEFIPANGKASVENYSRYDVKSYSIYEADDIVYLWYGQDQPDHTPGFFEEMHDKEYSVSELCDHWHTHYSRAIENQLDVAHLPFIHHNTIGRGNRTLANGPKTLWVDDFTMVTSANNSVDQGQLRKPSEECEIKATYLTFKFPNLWLNHISDKIKVMAFFAPVDEENTLMYIRFYNRITGIKPIDSAIAWIGKWMNLTVERQDRRIVITQRPKASALKMKEHLFKADLPILEYRKKREALKQLSKGEES